MNQEQIRSHRLDTIDPYSLRIEQTIFEVDVAEGVIRERLVAEIQIGHASDECKAQINQVTLARYGTLHRINFGKFFVSREAAAAAAVSYYTERIHKIAVA